MMYHGKNDERRVDLIDLDIFDMMVELHLRCAKAWRPWGAEPEMPSSLHSELITVVESPCKIGMVRSNMDGREVELVCSRLACQKFGRGSG